MNRKLIRPSLTDYKEQRSKDSARKKQHPSYDTHAENYYYLKQMNKKTRMALVLVEGETVFEIITGLGPMLTHLSKL